MLGNATFPIHTNCELDGNYLTTLHSPWICMKAKFLFWDHSAWANIQTYSSDGTSKKLSDTQGKNKTTMMCVANCILINYMPLSFNVAQGMVAKKQA